MKKIFFLSFFLSIFLLSAQELPFIWKSRAEGNKLYVTVDVAENHYFYRSTLVMDVQDASKKLVYPAVIPNGKVVADDIFGQVEVYPAGHWQWVFESDGPIVKCSVNFQGCRKGTAGNPGMCFMPETVDLLPDRSPVAKIEEKIALLAPALDGFRFERKLTGLHDAPSFLAWLDGKEKLSSHTVSWAMPCSHLHGRCSI